MRQIGLRAEILFNILFLTAVAMFLVGIMAFKVTERFALQGRIDGIKSIISVFVSLYAKDSDMERGISFLKDALGPGAWGVIADTQRRVVFYTGPDRAEKSTTDPLIIEVMKSGRTVVDVDGINIPPFAFYKGFKVASPIRRGTLRDGVILIYQPLSSLEENMALGRRLLAISIILDLVVIAFFGFYILSRRVVRPVQRLIRTTEEIARGRFPDEMDVGGVKEINQLYLALKEMYDEIEGNKRRLKENIEALQESNRALLRTQKELITSEKLASLGRLAAGVAHEIGNPLSAIRGYVEVLKRGHMFNDEKRIELLTNIQREVDRIDRIIRTLLDYSRPRDFELRRIDVNDAIRRAVEIVRAQGILKKVDLKLELSEGLTPVEADLHQLSQVIINLILNAKDAVSEGGVIMVSSSHAQNGGIEIAVSDNGIGIPKEAMNRIFDPFFTTKEPGKGTGLGLSVSQRIIRNFNGGISVESEPGRGSTFKITFPGTMEHRNEQGSSG
ncbi:MAG TPA: ATP-binding protein [Thermodesulfobacteriota bacterium]|nr:ATP-binding protein [Thermodesulfobacteriota bacterium]